MSNSRTHDTSAARASSASSGSRASSASSGSPASPASFASSHWADDVGAGLAARDRQGRAARIAKTLDELFPAPAMPLDHQDPFQLLVAVILSAQCTDARVNMVTPALFARAPNAHAMAKLTAAQIMPYIRTCGLAPGKAKNLAAMSQILIKDHGGEVPNDIDALERLPGVGHKTASVVMVQAFGKAAFPVDTHIHRLAGRWQLSRARNVEEVERDLKQLFPEDRWHLLHLQIIYFGRAYCMARNHDRASCPICSWAMSSAREREEARQGSSKPTRRKRAAAKPIAAKPVAGKPKAQKPKAVVRALPRSPSKSRDKR
jgi:endonuclease-3